MRIVTQQGTPAGTLLTPEEYDELAHQKAFRDSAERGIADAESGKMYRTGKVRAVLARRRKRA